MNLLPIKHRNILDQKETQLKKKQQKKNQKQKNTHIACFNESYKI